MANKKTKNPANRKPHEVERARNYFNAALSGVIDSYGIEQMLQEIAADTEETMKEIQQEVLSRVARKAPTIQRDFHDVTKGFEYLYDEIFQNFLDTVKREQETLAKTKQQIDNSDAKRVLREVARPTKDIRLPNSTPPSPISVSTSRSTALRQPIPHSKGASSVVGDREKAYITSLRNYKNSVETLAEQKIEEIDLTVDDLVKIADTAEEEFIDLSKTVGNIKKKTGQYAKASRLRQGHADRRVYAENVRRAYAQLKQVEHPEFETRVVRLGSKPSDPVAIEFKTEDETLLVPVSAIDGGAFSVSKNGSSIHNDYTLGKTSSGYRLMTNQERVWHNIANLRSGYDGRVSLSQLKRAIGRGYGSPEYDREDLPTADSEFFDKLEQERREDDKSSSRRAPYFDWGPIVRDLWDRATIEDRKKISGGNAGKYDVFTKEVALAFSIMSKNKIGANITYGENMAPWMSLADLINEENMASFAPGTRELLRFMMREHEGGTTLLQNIYETMSGLNLEDAAGSSNAFYGKTPLTFDRGNINPHTASRAAHQVLNRARLKDESAHHSQDTRFASDTAVKIVSDMVDIDEARRDANNNEFNVGFVSQKVLRDAFENVWNDYLANGARSKAIGAYFRNELGMTALPGAKELKTLSAEEQTYWKDLAYSRSTPGLGEGQALVRDMTPFLSVLDREYKWFEDEINEELDNLLHDPAVDYDSSGDQMIARKIKLGNTEIDLLDKNADKRAKNRGNALELLYKYAVFKATGLTPEMIDENLDNISLFREQYGDNPERVVARVQQQVGKQGDLKGLFGDFGGRHAIRPYKFFDYLDESFKNADVLIGLEDIKSQVWLGRVLAGLKYQANTNPKAFREFFEKKENKALLGSGKGRGLFSLPEGVSLKDAKNFVVNEQNILNYLDPENIKDLNKALEQHFGKEFFQHASSTVGTYGAFPHMKAPQVDDNFMAALFYSLEEAQESADTKEAAQAFAMLQESLRQSIALNTGDDRAFTGRLGKLNYSFAHSLNPVGKLDLTKFDKIDSPKHLYLKYTKDGLVASRDQKKWDLLVSSAALHGAKRPASYGGRITNYSKTVSGLIQQAIAEQYGEEGINYLTYLLRNNGIDIDSAKGTQHISHLTLPYEVATPHEVDGKDLGTELPLWASSGFSSMIARQAEHLSNVDTTKDLDEAETAGAGRIFNFLSDATTNRKSAPYSDASHAQLEWGVYQIPHRLNTTNNLHSQVEGLNRNAIFMSEANVRSSLSRLSAGELRAVAKQLGRSRFNKDVTKSDLLNFIVEAITPGSKAYEKYNRTNPRGLLSNVLRYPLIQQDAIKWGEVFVGKELGQQEVLSGYVLTKLLRGDFDQDHLGIASTLAQLAGQGDQKAFEKAMKAAYAEADLQKEAMQYWPDASEELSGVIKIAPQQALQNALVIGSIYNRYSTGKLSTVNTFLRRNLAAKKMNSGLGSRDKSSLVSLFGEIMEQEAISAKHIADAMNNSEVEAALADQIRIFSKLETLSDTLMTAQDAHGIATDKRWDDVVDIVAKTDTDGKKVFQSTAIRDKFAKLLARRNKKGGENIVEEDGKFFFQYGARDKSNQLIDKKKQFQIGETNKEGKIVALDTIETEAYRSFLSDYEDLSHSRILRTLEKDLTQLLVKPKDYVSGSGADTVDSIIQHYKNLGIDIIDELNKPTTFWKMLGFEGEVSSSSFNLTTKEVKTAENSAGFAAEDFAEKLGGAGDAVAAFVKILMQAVNAFGGNAGGVKGRSFSDLLGKNQDAQMTLTQYAKLITGSHAGVDRSYSHVFNRWRDWRHHEGASAYAEMLQDLRDEENPDKILENRVVKDFSSYIGMSSDNVSRIREHGRPLFFGTLSHDYVEGILGAISKLSSAQIKDLVEQFKANPEGDVFSVTDTKVFKEQLSALGLSPEELKAIQSAEEEFRAFSAAIGDKKTTTASGLEAMNRNAALWLNALGQEGLFENDNFIGTEFAFAPGYAVVNKKGQSIGTHPDLLRFAQAKNEKGRPVTDAEDLVYVDFKTNASGQLSADNIVQAIGTVAVLNALREDARKLVQEKGKDGIEKTDLEKFFSSDFLKSNPKFRKMMEAEDKTAAVNFITRLSNTRRARAEMIVANREGYASYGIEPELGVLESIVDLLDQAQMLSPEEKKALKSAVSEINKQGIGERDEELGTDEQVLERSMSAIKAFHTAQINAQHWQDKYDETHDKQYLEAKEAEVLKGVDVSIKHGKDLNELKRREIIDDSMRIIDEDTFTKYADELNEHDVKQRERAERGLLKMPPTGGAKEFPTLAGSLGNSFKRVIGQFLNFGLANKILSKFAQTIKKVISLTKELDAVSVNIQVVTGKNAEEVRSLMKSYSDLALQLGVTTKEVATAANQWLRQGYNVAETQKLITSSTLLSKLGMTDMNTAVEVLTSTMKGFGIEAQNSMSIVDQLTALDQKFAASASEIGTALAKTAAVANNAGMSLEETEGALAVMIDVTQESAQTVGTALRSLLSRYGQVRANSFAAMSEGLDDDSAKINDIERVLNTLGIQMRSSAYDMRDIGDVLDDLYEKWGSLSDVEKGAVSTAFAGMRQRNYFLTLMDHYTEYKEAVETASEAEGTATAKNEARLGSIEYALNKITVAWEKLTQKLNSGDFLRGTSGALAGLIENLDHVLLIVSRIAIGMNAWRIPVGMEMATKFLGFEKGAFSKDKISQSWFGRGLKKQWLTQEEINQKKGIASGTGYGEFEANTKNAAASLLNFGEVVDDVSKKMVHDAQLESDARSENTKITENETAVKQQEQAEYVEGIKIKSQEHIAAIQVARSKMDEAFKATRAAGADVEKTKAAYDAAKADYYKAQQTALQYQKGTSSGSDNSFVSGLASKGAGSTAAAMAGSGILSAFMALATNSNGLSEGLGVGNFLGRLGTAIDADEYNAAASEVGKYGASRWVGAGLQGGGAAIGTLIAPGLGTIIGSAVGGLINEVLGGWLQQNKVLAKVEEKRAQKSLEAIQKIGSSVDKIASLSSKSVLSYDTDDWQNLRDQVENALSIYNAGGVGAVAYSEVFPKYLSSELFSSGQTDAITILNNLVANWPNLSDEQHQQLLAAMYGAQRYAEGAAQNPANQSARDAAYDKLQEGIADLDRAGYDEDKRTQAQIKIQAARNEINALDEAEENPKIQAALAAAGRSLTDVQKKNSSEEAVIYAAAKFYQEIGGTAFGPAGNISPSFRNKAMTFIHSDEELNGKIGTSAPTTFNDLVSITQTVEDLIDAGKDLKVLSSVSELKNIALLKDETQFKNILTEMLGHEASSEEIQKYRAIATSNADTSLQAIKRTYGNKILPNSLLVGQEIDSADKDQQAWEKKILTILGNLLTSVGAIGTVADLEEAMDSWKAFAEKVTNNSLTSQDILSFIGNETTRSLVLDENYRIDFDGIANRYWSLLADPSSSFYNAMLSQWFTQQLPSSADFWSLFVTGLQHEQYIDDENLRQDIINGKYQTLKAFYSSELSKAQVEVVENEEDEFVKQRPEDEFEDTVRSLEDLGDASKKATQQNNNLAQSADTSSDKLTTVTEAFFKATMSSARFLEQYREQLKSVLTDLITKTIDIRIAELNFQKQLLEETKWPLEDMQKAIQDQQKPLNRLTDAISHMNEAQERQRSLEKAKERLDQAKEDKQRVYREGVGWVYEANQEKVREAQEQLDAELINASVFEINSILWSLDEQLNSVNDQMEDIDNQITAISREIQIFTDQKTQIELQLNEQELQKLTDSLKTVFEIQGPKDAEGKEQSLNFFDIWQYAMTRAGFTLPSWKWDLENGLPTEEEVNSFATDATLASASTAIVNAITGLPGGIAGVFAKSGTWYASVVTAIQMATGASDGYDFEEVVDNLKILVNSEVERQYGDELKSRAEAVSTAYSAWQELDARDGTGSVSSKQIEAYRDYLDARDQYLAFQGKASKSGMVSDDYLYGLRETYEGVVGPKFLPGKKTRVTDGEVPKDWELEVYKGVFGPENVTSVEEGRELVWILDSWDAYSDSIQLSTVSKSIEAGSWDPGDQGVFLEGDMPWGSLSGRQVAAENWVRDNFNSLTLKQKLLIPRFLTEAPSDKNFGEVMSDIGSGILAVGGAAVGLIGDVLSGRIFQMFDEDTWETDEYGFTPYSTANMMEWVDRGHGKNIGSRMGKNFYDSHVNGAISLPQNQLSLINELGTEGIITPQGTISALPSKTGIVPADITKNLWQLGEIAPTLVKEAYAPKVLESAASQTYDNSMNFQNFYQTIEAKDGFDMEEFLRQARQYVQITKNQRHF